MKGYFYCNYFIMDTVVEIRIKLTLISLYYVIVIQYTII